MDVSSIKKTKLPLVIAHRGGNHGPDNALETFKTAVALHADMIELDVRKTKDNHLVVFHDAHIDRITNGKGSVSHYKLSSLRRFRLMNDEPIPTLEQVFKAIGRKTRFLIELKDTGMERKVVALVKKYRLSRRVIICSFKPESLQKVKELGPRMEVGYLIWGCNMKNVVKAKQIGCKCILPNNKNLTPLFVDLSQMLGLEVYGWTVDAPKRMRQLMTMGVDGIITNKLEALHKVMHSKDKKKLSFFKRLFSKHK